MGAYGSPELHPNFDNSRQSYENMVVCKKCGTNYHKINKNVRIAEHLINAPYINDGGFGLL